MLSVLSWFCYLENGCTGTTKTDRVNPITSQKVFGMIFSTPNVYYMFLLITDEK